MPAETRSELHPEASVKSVTSLGQALQALAGSWDTAKGFIGKVGKATDYFQVQAIGKADTEMVQAFEAERQQIARRRGEIEKVLGGVIDDLSSPALLNQYLKIRSDMLEVLAAEKTGLIDSEESAESLKELRHALAKARGAAEAAGANVDGPEAGSLVQTSTWAKIGGNKRVQELTELVKGAAMEGGAQMAGCIEGLMSLAKGLPIAGGLFGLMLWGVHEKDRLKAQAGEVVNLAVAAGGDAHTKGVAGLAAFQEKAQNFYGISRREVQKNAKTFIDAGISLDEIFKQEDKTLGEVGTNAITLSLALDRHFEIGQGTTARAATKMVTDYGMHLDASVKVLEKMEFAAQKGGFGVGSFVNWTMQATSNVRLLGISMEETASAAVQMKEYYAKMGAGNEANSLAEQGVGEAWKGIAGQGMARQVWMAGELGLGKGLEGRQRLKEGLVGGQTDMAARATSVIRKDAMKAGGGDEVQARQYLEMQGYGFEGARTIMELGSKFGKDTKLHEISAEDKKRLTKAFTEEGKKTSDIQKNMKEALAGMSKMGQGFLMMFTSFSAIAIVGMKTIPVLLAGSTLQKEEVYNKFKDMGGTFSKGWHDVIDGGQSTIHGLRANLDPLLGPITRAIDWRYTKDQPSAWDTAPDASQAGSEKVMSGVLKQLTGDGQMDEGRRAVLFGGLPADEVDRLVKTPEGREELKRKAQASIEKHREAAAQREKAASGGHSGGQGGPSSRGQPATHPADESPSMPGFRLPDFSKPGSMGSMDRKNPLPDEPIHGPLGAVKIHTHWSVTDPSKPMEVVVRVEHG